MLRISFVQPNYPVGPSVLNSHFLPYSVGCIWAYAQQNQLIKDNIQLDHIVFKRNNIAEVVSQLETSDIIAFSHYIWNRNYNLKIAELCKLNNPACKIIFGGPEVPITDQNIFRRYPFIDYVVVREGETVFEHLLLHLINSQAVPKGTIINVDGIAKFSGDAERIEDLSILPSPYLTGVFDKIIRDNPSIEWNATLETNRGCPYACTFCDWGSLTYSKIKQFNLDKVFAELEWIGQHRCGSVVIADANFGIFLSRDSAIADKLLAVQNQYGYPYTYTASWAKNQKREVLNIVKKLSKKGLTLSVQSMNNDVLENIKRKNLEQHKIQEIFALCEQNNLPVDTELILGLPGESLESFKNGMFELFKQGNHTGISIYQAQLLENAEMNLQQKDSFEIASSLVYDYIPGSSLNDEVVESIEIVTATKDMPLHDMQQAQVFAWFINTFHINGISNFAARFMYKFLGEEYSKFYSKLFNHFSKVSWFAEQIEETKHHYSNWMLNGKVDHPKVAGITLNGSNLIHRTVMKIHCEEWYDKIFAELYQFLSVHYNNPYLHDLLLLQSNYLIQFKKLKDYPQQKEFSSDIYGYLVYDSDITQKSQYQFIYDGASEIDIGTFLQKIFYNRRMNFGKAKIVKYTT